MPGKGKSSLYLASLRLERWPRSTAIVVGTAAVFLVEPFRFPAQLTIELGLKLLLAFILTWMISTANYIVNEITDAPFDAHHPQKKNRPLVAKEISVPILLGVWALHGAKAAVAEPLALAEASRDKAEGLLAGAEAEVARLEGVEQEQIGQIDALTQRVRELEMSTAAQQATIQEKVASVARLDAQLAEAQNALAARDQELAGLRASAKAVEGLQGQLDALQRTVQGLTASAGAGAPSVKGGKK